MDKPAAHRAGRRQVARSADRMTRRAMVAGVSADGAASGLMVGFICQTAVFLGRLWAALRISAQFRAAMVPYWQTRVQVRKSFLHSDGCFISRIERVHHLKHA